jgi:hypothetical protein
MIIKRKCAQCGSESSLVVTRPCIQIVHCACCHSGGWILIAEERHSTYIVGPSITTLDAAVIDTTVYTETT